MSLLLAHFGRADPPWKCPLIGGKRTPFGAKADEEAKRYVVRAGQRKQSSQSLTRLALIIGSSRYLMPESRVIGGEHLRFVVAEVEDEPPDFGIGPQDRPCWWPSF